MKKYRIFTINPGSTSTKIALFEDENCVFQKNVSHASDELDQFSAISDQLPYRKETIMEALTAHDVELENIDAVAGRGGGLHPVEGGVYAIDELLLEHARIGINGVAHPAQLGSQLANEFASQLNVPSFAVNPPDVDELQEVARITGVKGVYRNVHLHALNLKETAIQHAQKMGRSYETCSFIVCHIGGGVSVSAHQKGKMIDGFDIVGGEGPMAPTRSGSLSVVNVLESIEKSSLKDTKALCTRNGGFVSHLGTSDTLEVMEKIRAGDSYAKLVWEAMIYQIGKCIGAMAVVLKGNVDGILLGGGIVYSKELVEKIEDSCSFIAPLTAYPGEFEMEAMSAGAIRVLKGEEKARKYTGTPVWNKPLVEV